MKKTAFFISETKGFSSFFLIVICCIVVLSIHLFTISTSPIIWQDEVQIVDLGHNLLSPDDPSSIVYLNSGRKVLPQYSYWGASLHELCYRTFKCFFSHRICSIVFFIFIPLACFLWLRSVCQSNAIAVICSLLLLFDPQLTQSARGGRCDSEALFFLFLAAFFLEHGIQHIEDGKFIIPFFLSGFCLICGFSFWITSAFTIFFWMAYVISATLRLRMSTTSILQSIFWGLLGVVTALLLSMMLYKGEITYMFSSPSYQQSALCLSNLRKIYKFPNAFRFSPHIFAGLFLFFAMRKKWLWGSACAMTIFLMAFTPVYIHRMHYLYPFSILFIACFLKKYDFISKKIWRRAIIIYLITCFTYTVIGRTVITILTHNKRNVNFLSQAFKQSKISSSRHASVYLDSFGLYFIVREMGLKYYCLADKTDSSHVADFIFANDIDYIVSQEKHLSKLLSEKYTLSEILKCKATNYGTYYLFEKKHSHSEPPH